ncbi:hypothetical protein [Psittacicella hinzii]|uniref:Uncharacterized protein n=1 Tax=Psittacicella hinzii TaxID=2028575 RepID=A0A3A1YP96_9GAMM|nr:hypothetical protein [Psittacicella hinzii]RIY39371.1 hypothetical protein CKF58_02315 [Psittacicella hinzii]
MVKVQYTNDVTYDLSTADLEQIKQWPNSILIGYHLKVNNLSPNDLEVIRSPAYSKLTTKHPFVTDKEYARSTYLKFIRSLFVIPLALTFLGFLVGYFTYFQPNAIFSTINYTAIFYILSSAAIYIGSIFSLQVVTEVVMQNKLKAAARLLFPHELAQGLTAKFTLAWIALQVMIQLVMYAICST